MTSLYTHFQPSAIQQEAEGKVGLLINPPVYDTQYWAEWSQPYGLLRIGALLAKLGYKRRELFDFMEDPGERRTVAKRRLAPKESFVEMNVPTPKSPPYRIEKDGQVQELWKYYFGKSWEEFDAWLNERGFTSANPPDELWISATMSYWWDSARDLVARLRHSWGMDARRVTRGPRELGGTKLTEGLWR